MLGKKVLIIDDDIDSLRLSGLQFTEAGAIVYTARDGLEGISKLHSQQPDLIVLDVMMPGVSGFDVCKQIRKISNVPVIMLTALGQESNVLHGLNAGADDYLQKPFSPDILLARARAVMRRSEPINHKAITNDYDDGHLKIDFEKHQVFIDGKHIKLTPLEFKLLVFLHENSGRVLSFAKILQNVWGAEYQGSDDYVHIYVSHLRGKIEQNSKNPHYITSVRGVGYLFEKEGGSFALEKQVSHSTDHN